MFGVSSKVLVLMYFATYFRECYVVYVQRRKLRGGGDLGDIGRRRSNHEVSFLYIFYIFMQHLSF